MTSNEKRNIDPENTPPFSCFACKLNFELNYDKITCSECSKCYHISCSNLSKKKIRDIKNCQIPNFKCFYCKTKNKCSRCLRNDPLTSVYCFNCDVLSCYICANISIEEVKKLNTSPKLYHCDECSSDYYCAVCKSLCRDGCIMCDVCKSWIHFKCSKLTRKQLRRYSTTEDKYYCTPCISTSLPFNRLADKKLNILNSNDKVTLSKETRLPAETNFQDGKATCDLCMECNPECTQCTDSACPDPQNVCSICCDCKYVEIDQFKGKIEQFNSWYSSTLSIMHFNTRSLTKNLTKIIDILQLLDSPLDIMLISETKLNDKSADIQSVRIDGYTFYPTFTSMAFGGTGIYILSDIDCIRRDDLNLKCEGCESTFLELPTKGCQKNVVIGAIYRHPLDNHHDFLSSFYSQVEKISQTFNVILLGDMNLDVSLNVRSKPVVDYKNMLFSLSLRNLISKPTRITKNSETTIDHVLTNVPNQTIYGGILNCDVADHLPVYALCSFCPSRHIMDTNTLYRSITTAKKGDYIKVFKNEIAKINFREDDDPDLHLHDLIKAVNKAADSAFPWKHRSNKYKKRFRKPWMTQGILNSIRKRHRLYKKFLYKRDDESWNIYTNHCNTLTRIKEQAKDFRYITDFTECSGDSKMTWKKINKILNKSKPKNKLPTELNGTKDPKSIANNLNNYFVSKGQKLASKLPKANKSIYNYLMPRVEEAISEFHIEIDEVANSIKDLKTNKAPGYDHISPKMIKWLAEEIAPLIAKVFNKYLEHGKYPDTFKIAKVTALHKAGDTKNCENYRPISVLPQLNQIFEKLIHSHLTDFFNHNNILTKNQYGFRKGHSTSHGITHLNEKLIENLEKKCVSAVLFIDLKAAFDTINHDILIQKLEHYGVRGSALSLLQSYLVNRKQYVGGEGLDSILMEINIGVPQGSVLGPLLFIIFINDLINCTILEAVLFADDAAFLKSHTSLKHLQKIMNDQTKLICEWLIVNKLTINVKKTKYMVFHQKRDAKFKRMVKKFKLNVNNYCIKQVDEFKYLGLNIDNKLNWNKHIDYLCTQVSKGMGILYRFKSKMPTCALKLIYHSLIGSKLRYGVSAWGSGKSTALQKLNLLNNGAVKNLKQPSETLQSAYKRLKLFTINSLYKLETAKFIKLFKDGKLPAEFDSIGEPINHHHQTRIAMQINYQLPHVRTDLGKSSIKFQGIKVWNNLPEQIKNQNGASFKKQLKTHILEHQLSQD